jgi:hypothetical protein
MELAKLTENLPQKRAKQGQGGDPSIKSQGNGLGDRKGSIQSVVNGAIQQRTSTFKNSPSSRKGRRIAV